MFAMVFCVRSIGPPRSRRPQQTDIIKMLVSIFGNKEVFLEEYRPRILCVGGGGGCWWASVGRPSHHTEGGPQPPILIPSVGPSHFQGAPGGGMAEGGFRYVALPSFGFRRLGCAVR